MIFAIHGGFVMACPKRYANALISARVIDIDAICFKHRHGMYLRG